MTLRIPAGAALAILALGVAGGPAAAQAEFHWKGAIAAGKTIEIKGVNGDINVVAGSGETDVSATKSAHRSDPDEVKIAVVPSADGVTICAVYPSRGDRENVCESGRHSHMDVENNDVRVEFTVRLPRGVRFAGGTVNGDIEATDVASDVEAHTVNGSIHISTSGAAEAHTVNGSITASLGRADWTEPLEFRTVNGSITISLPATVSADVRANTVNGDIVTDFPLTVTGRLGRRGLNGTIGQGGRRLALETVNGTIHLRKAG